MITYRLLDASCQEALALKNEPFEIFGRLKVSRTNEIWTAEEELFSVTTTLTFPDEAYNFAELAKKGYVVGAFSAGACVGLAIFESTWFKHDYLADLKVRGDFKRQGVGRGLLQFALAKIKNEGLAGITTIAQDNNLAACRFYMACGFEIGGLNTAVYRHTTQADKSDIYFYLE